MDEDGNKCTAINLPRERKPQPKKTWIRLKCGLLPCTSFFETYWYRPSLSITDPPTFHHGKFEASVAHRHDFSNLIVFRYEYVKSFETSENLLPNTWIAVRIDGRGFHKLSAHYSFSKPNDRRALGLMNHAATHTVQSLSDITIAYGVSDEFSFVFRKATTLFERRREKIVSTVVSTFTAAYVLAWGRFFDQPLDTNMLPTFDGRAVCYPSWENLRDYLNWRQVDCHINNLYNTTFWALVQKGEMSATDAEELLKGTVLSDKNEILWSRFGINYNNEPEMFKKGSIVLREYSLRDSTVPYMEEPLSKTQAEKQRKARQKAMTVTLHLDLIKEDFWDQRPWLKTGKSGKPN
jgi:tRNA(His) guanylyltransferase